MCSSLYLAAMNWKWLWLLLLIGPSVADFPTAETKYGPIEGTHVTFMDGRQVEAFMGVPYADPPTGKYRFAAPRPPTPWNETRPTKSVSKSCIQAVSKELKEAVWSFYDGPESEDCLYLNVWKPLDCYEGPLPVMIWIHGGAFLGGSASIPIYDGSILATESCVIVVSMNYRLAQFGFLYLNTSEVPGNAGLQDQIMAIRWVSENIYNFGGDPERVTMFGESVGGTSISIHLVNSDVSYLFQYAIMQSGSLYQETLTSTEEHALQVSLDVARKTGCLEYDTKKTLKCLREAPVEYIIKAYTGVNIIFVPVRNGKEVPKYPLGAVESVPNSKRKNIVCSNIPLEASIFAPFIFPGKNFTEDFSVNEYELRALIATQYHIEDPRLQDVIMHEYKNFETPYNSSNLRIEALDMLTDTLFICPGIGFIKSWVTEENKSFYLYFAQRPSRAIKLPAPEWVGPTHADDVIYIFGTPLDPSYDYTTEDIELSKKMMRYWTDFAKFGNPNHPFETYWPRVDPNHNFKYLTVENYEEKPKMYLKERQCEFWAHVYPSLLVLQEKLHYTS